MKKELEDKLFTEFPDIFPGGRNVDMRANLMCFGFECDDGWYDLIYDLCRDIQKELDENPELKLTFCAVQVKEKFGGLRFYTSTSTEAIDKLIDKAEKRSEITCEVCGKDGINISRGGWLQTVCKKHAKKEK